MAKKAKMVVWDVSHGLAVYVNAPNGKHIVIDLGTGSHTSGKPFSPLLHLKSGRGGEVKKLDYLVVTHPHADHLDDILNLDSAMEPKVFCRPNLAKGPILEGLDKDRKQKVGKYFEIDARYTSPIPAASALSDPANWGGLRIRTFGPKPETEDNINDHSIVTVFEYAQSKIVVPGDNEPPSWKLLRAMGGFMDAVKNADILVAPHHGRESGWDAEMVGHINPRLTIISDKAAETSAVDKYSGKSRGMTVHKGGKAVERKCLTTRSDGWVKVELWIDDTSKKPVRRVSIA
ncbi:MAG: MBL fold metallo-hydrolase [Armatimonadetes bacterium]|nr:MBL fold metallo-hydrolase [Armatimonadota bacterium]